MSFWLGIMHLAKRLISQSPLQSFHVAKVLISELCIEAWCSISERKETPFPTKW